MPFRSPPRPATRFATRFAALLAPIALAAGLATGLAATSAGTIISNTATATYVDAADNARSVTSNTVTTEVQTVYALTVAPDAGNAPTEATDWSLAVAPANDLDQVNPGDVAQFAWTVTNDTNAPATISLEFLQDPANPFALTGVGLFEWTDDGDGMVADAELSAVSGPLAFGQESAREFVVRGTVDAAGATPGGEARFDLRATNDSAVAAGAAGARISYESNNLARVTLPAVDLSTATAITDNPAPVVGESVEATVTVANAGPDAASGVQASVRLPDGLTSTGFTLGGAAAAPASSTTNPDGSTTYVFDLPDLALGASVAIVATGTVDASNDAGVLPGQTLTVSAGIAGSDQLDTDAANDPSSADFTVRSADVGIVKTVDTTSATYGDEIAYTLTVTNAGPDAADGVVATDDLPAGLELVSATASTGSVVDDATGAAPAAGAVGPALTWTVGALASGATETLVIRARIVASGSIDNSAAVASTGPGDPNTANDRSSAPTVGATAADLSLAGSADAAVADAGDPVTFTWTVANAGPDAPSGVTADGLLPAGFDWISTAGAGTFDPATGVWTLADALAPGDSATLSITAAPVAAAAGTTIDVAAEIASSSLGDPDSTPGDGSTGQDDDALVQVRVTRIDLSLTADVSASDAGPWGGTLAASEGDTVYFRTSVTNAAGSDAATGVAVDGILPSGVSFAGVTSVSAGSYDDATGIWTVGAIAAGATETLVIAATVDTGGAGASHAAAPEVATADQADPDSTPGNDAPAEDDEDATSLSVPYVDVAITAFDPSTVAPLPGGEVVFTITVMNDDATAGTGATASGVEIADALPAGVTYDPTSASNALNGASFDAATGTLALPPLAPGGSITVRLAATVDLVYTNGADGALVQPAIDHAIQVTALDQTDVDSTPGNLAGAPAEDDEAALSAAVDPLDSAIAVAKEVASFTAPADDAAPTSATNPFRVEFRFTVENVGDTDLTDVAVADDLDATFGAGNYGDVVVTSVSGGLSANGAYTGAAAAPVLATGSLASGAVAVVTLAVDVYADGTYANVATATAVDPEGNPVDDESVDGSEPDPDGDGDPGESGSTPVVLGSLSLVMEQRVCADASCTTATAWSTADAEVDPGEFLDYRTTAAAGTTDATFVVIQDLVPADTEFVSASGAGVIECRVGATWDVCPVGPDAAVEEVRWTIGVIAAGADAVVRMTVRVP